MVADPFARTRKAHQAALEARERFDHAWAPLAIVAANKRCERSDDALRRALALDTAAYNDPRDIETMTAPMLHDLVARVLRPR
jgi:hypothetical protein